MKRFLIGLGAVFAVVGTGVPATWGKIKQRYR